MVAYYIQVKEINTNWEWVTKKQLEEKYAMPTAFKKFPIELRWGGEEKWSHNLQETKYK